METRRSKRKEAAASESLTVEPRSKRARRAQADTKAKGNTSRQAKPETASAGASAVPDPSTVQPPKPAVPKVQLESAPERAASEAAEASTSQAEKKLSVKETESDNMGSRKDMAEAQERAALEQVRWHLACPTPSQFLPGCMVIYRGVFRKREQQSCLVQLRQLGELTRIPLQPGLANLRPLTLVVQGFLRSIDVDSIQHIVLLQAWRTIQQIWRFPQRPAVKFQAQGILLSCSCYACFAQWLICLSLYSAN